MPDIIFRPGRLPSDPSQARLYFRMFWNRDFTPPASAIYTGMPYIGMMGNDQWGDCVYACQGHTTEEQTYNGQGTEYQVSDSAVLQAYAQMTGFNPAAGPPGRNPTDRGDTVQNGLKFLNQTGFGGHKIAAYAQVTAGNLAQVRTAVYEFGVVTIGLSIYQAAMNQFNSGQPWDVVSNQGALLGGHCVDIVGYDATYLYCYTWGAVQKLTWAFWNRYVAANGGEAWASIGTDWVSAATGKDPLGVDKYAFGAQYAALTGQPNPFPAPSDIVTVSNPGTQTSTTGTAIPAVSITASSSAGNSIASFTAAGLPAGLMTSQAGGVLTISGTPSTVQMSMVTVTAKDSAGVSGSAAFTWNVISASPVPPDSYDVTLASAMHTWLAAKGL